MQTIGIDARFYGTEQKGLGRYVQKLVEELEHLDAPYQFKIFLTKKGFELYQPASSRFQPVLMDVPWYGWREQREVPKILNREACELVHFPHFNVPFAYKRPYIVTIHDLILFDHPSRRASKLSWPLYQAKYAAFKLNLSHTLKQARQILTVSAYTQSRLIKYFPWTQEKIRVTHIAPGQASLKTDLQLSDLGMTSPYILYVGNAYPHKNLEFLVRAFHAYLTENKHSHLNLVFVGKLDYFYFRLQELINSLAWPAQQIPVKVFGYATESQLACLFQHASAYVFPSLEEGFGIPPLEAMQYNIPVLSSQRGSMPEILGKAALYFDPTSAADFTQKLSMILTNARLREDLIRAGQAQAQRYSWQACAQQTLQAYQSALSTISRKGQGMIGYRR